MKIYFTMLPSYTELSNASELTSSVHSINLLSEIANSISGCVSKTIDIKEYSSNYYSGDRLKSIMSTIDKHINFEEQDTIIGFSTNAFNWGFTKKIIEIIKNRNSNTTILLGGVHATYFYKVIICNVDHIFVGDADNSIKSFLNNKMEDITNDRIIFPEENNDTTLYVNYESINKKWNYKMFPLEASRGCCNNCTFCSIRHKRLWTPFNKENILNNIQRVSEDNNSNYKQKTIVFTDDCFTTDVVRCVDIINNISYSNIDVFFEARVEDLLNDYFYNIDKNKIMSIQIGVESGYDTGLHKINKGITTNDINKMLIKLKNNNMVEKVFLSFIIFFPWETMDDVYSTIDFVNEISTKYGVVCNIIPYLLLPSYIYSKRKDFGIDVDYRIYDQEDWFLNDEIFYQTHPNINKNDVENAREKIIRYRQSNDRIHVSGMFTKNL